MDRSEIWLTQIGRKTRPVLILTRNEVIDVRTRITVAEITTHIRGLAAEVDLDSAEAGLRDESAVNCDGLHTISRASLTRYIGRVDETTMQRVCAAVSYSVGC